MNSLHPRYPCTALVGGAAGCRQTHLVKKLIDFKMINPFPPKIIWWYGACQNLYKEMKNVEFHEGLPSDINTISNTLIFIDYLQVLQKFVKIQHPQEEKTETRKILDTATPENQETEDIQGEKEDAITTKIYSVAKTRTIFEHCKNILDFLKANNTILSWTPEGEIVCKGQRLPRTNIVSLVADVLRHIKKSPKGSSEFYAALKEMNIPSSLVINKNQPEWPPLNFLVYFSNICHFPSPYVDKKFEPTVTQNAMTIRRFFIVDYSDSKILR
ncbi:hypothetical protein AVEN_163984-1 [Araneus ventricosus]|uniref:Uncharacterized protein n=1 Tax=Araneus ventricosus TaxID=182803 RepID=A0A4Y2D872_ARAVE|nr:hypothetical protein AVEN_163984-1 [Araneus ventricosus]